MTRFISHLRSIRGRITLVSTLLVAVTLVVASVVLMRWVQADLLESAQETLDEALAVQAELLGISEAELVEADFGTSEFFTTAVDGRQVSVGLFTGDGDAINFGELLIDDLPVAGLALDADTGEIVEIFDVEFFAPLEDEELSGQIAALAANVMEIGEVESLEAIESEDGGRFEVGTASLDEVEESIAAIRQALMVMVPSLIMLFALLTWWLIGRALRPVMSITSQVEAISSSSLDRRIPVPETDDEVADLASVMNRMLDRLQRGGERQRQFSADASHELRSPLSTVRAAAEMIGMHPTPDRAKRLSEDIVAESDRMDELISDLLELSRLDEDGRALAMEETNLVELLRTELESDLADASVRFESPPSVTMVAAPRQLRRLVRNLVDNASRHADDEVVVSLTTTSLSSTELDDRRVVLLTVDDDGAGVADDAKRTIFERFSRLDEARSRDGGGAGLGLALVRAIAEGHGGSVMAEDSPLGGARFSVVLPIDSGWISALP